METEAGYRTNSIQISYVYGNVKLAWTNIDRFSSRKGISDKNSHWSIQKATTVLLHTHLIMTCSVSNGNWKWKRVNIVFNQTISIFIDCHVTIQFTDYIISEYWSM